MNVEAESIMAWKREKQKAGKENQEANNVQQGPETSKVTVTTLNFCLIKECVYFF